MGFPYLFTARWYKFNDGTQVYDVQAEEIYIYCDFQNSAKYDVVYNGLYVGVHSDGKRIFKLTKGPIYLNYRANSGLTIGPRPRLNFLTATSGLIVPTLTDDAVDDEAEIRHDIFPGAAYTVMIGTPAWSNSPEVVNATVRTLLTLGVNNSISGIAKFLDEFSARYVSMKSANLLASQAWTLPKSLPSVRQFFQAYGVSGADVETKWVGLDLATASVAGLSTIASVNNWEQLRFNSDFFEFYDPGTGEYGIVSLKKTLSASILYCHSGDTKPTWNTLIAGTGVTITPDAVGHTVTLAATGVWVGVATSNLEMRGYNIYMDNGDGTGGGDLYMDGGEIRCPSGSYLTDGSQPAIYPYSRNLIGSDGSSVSMHWTNSGIELGSKNIYMDNGDGTGGGDIYMDGGKIKFTTGDIVDQAAAQSDSVAATVADLVTDFNSLLSKLRTAGLIDT